MRNQTKFHLQQLQLAMQKLDLWQVTPPAQEAFLSQEPFAIDTMSPEEWLQWIFIPRMFALLESGADLPSQIAVSPYLEEAFKEAERIGIKGIVRNCVDGRVEIVAEGNDDQLQDFYNWLKVGPRTASVERVLVDDIEDKQYSDFSIIHR